MQPDKGRMPALASAVASAAVAAMAHPRPKRTLSEKLLGSPRRAERLLTPGPGAHRLPAFVMWGATLLTAVFMALINMMSLFAIEYAIRTKFRVMQHVIDNAGILMGVLVLTLSSCFFALIGAVMILWAAPECGGSGLPENKCYLNGSSMPDLFTWRTLFVRIATSILANVAGYPVGREGPFVTIGGNLAYLISHGLTLPFFRQWIDFPTGKVSTVIVDEERFAHATRINCAVGGACAMAMLFNTPIGGLLYMFEEISPAAWPLELTFRAFVGTTISALSSYWLLSLVNKQIREFVIFAWIPEDKEWAANDLPAFVGIAVVLGVVAACHTRMMLATASFRKRMHSKLRNKRVGVTIEAVLYCVLCVVLSCAASMISKCHPRAESELEYVQFNCPEGQYNPVASLLVTTSHSSVKLLFSGNNEGEIRWHSSLLAFLTYYILNVGLAGLPVPGGAFTATMVLGGLFGRTVGALLRDFGNYSAAVSGVYAVIGASAMLCGFKQMAAAVVLIVVQCVNDFNMTPVIMLTVSVALAVNRAINERGHDEEQIERKKLPYLENEIPPGLDEWTAWDMLDELPGEASLPRLATVAEVQAALEATKDTQFTDFPILDQGICLGIITRAHLVATVRAHRRGIRHGPSVVSWHSNAGSCAAVGGSATAGKGVLLRGVPVEPQLMPLAKSPGAKLQAFPIPDIPIESEGTPDSGGVRRDDVIMARVASGFNLHDTFNENGASVVSSPGVAVSPGGLTTDIPLDRIMDPTPFTIVEDMPAPRFYSLFAKAGERAACVTSKTGVYRGLISRNGLIAATRRISRPEGLRTASTRSSSTLP